MIGLGLWLWLGLRVRVKFRVRVRVGFRVRVGIRVGIRVRIRANLTLIKTLKLNPNLLSYWECCQNMVREKICAPDTVVGLRPIYTRRYSERDNARYLTRPISDFYFRLVVHLM